MKRIILEITTLTLCSFLFMGGCAGTGNVQQYVTPENARIATALVCSNTLLFAASDAERVNAANYVYSVSHAIRTLAGGRAPSVEELRAAIASFTPNGGKWVTLGVSIGSVYGGLYAKIQGNGKLAAEYLEAIAEGAEDAARSYLPPIALGTPIRPPQ